MAGKFNNAMDEAVYALTLDGTCEEVGSVHENGTWYGRVDGPLSDASQEHGINPDNLTPEQVAELQECIGAIVAEDSQGFVSVSYYHAGTEDQFNRDWDAIVAEVDAWYEESEESEDD